MTKPNFSEAQLQYCVNVEYHMWALTQDPTTQPPVIPNLVDEFGLGWDTAFYFPWLGPAPGAGQHGCNLFIQYKLSELVEGRRAGQWSDWHRPYMRFRIPFDKVMINGQWADDFHQLHALQQLAQQGLQVYYATNTVLTIAELFAQYQQKRLLDETPFLDVKDITSDHRVVTFADGAQHFFLHSERMESSAVNWRQLVGNLHTEPSESISYNNAKVYDIVKRQLYQMPAAAPLLQFYNQLEDGRDDATSVRQWVLLRYALLQFLNVQMLWFHH